jgi:hypothetical protein
MTIEEVPCWIELCRGMSRWAIVGRRHWPPQVDDDPDFRGRNESGDDRRVCRGGDEMRRHRRYDPSPRFKMKGPDGRTLTLILHDTRNGKDEMSRFGVPRTCILCCIKLLLMPVITIVLFLVIGLWKNRLATMSVSEVFALLLAAIGWIRIF